MSRPFIFFSVLIWQEYLYFHKLDEVRGHELRYGKIKGHELEWNPDFVFFYSIPSFIVIFMSFCVILWFSATWMYQSIEEVKAARKCAKHWMNFILVIGMGSISTYMILNMDWFLESLDVKVTWAYNGADTNICEWKHDIVIEKIECNRIALIREGYHIIHQYSSQSGIPLGRVLMCATWPSAVLENQKFGTLC